MLFCFWQVFRANHRLGWAAPFRQNRYRPSNGRQLRFSVLKLAAPVTAAQNPCRSSTYTGPHASSLHPSPPRPASRGPSHVLLIPLHSSALLFHDQFCLSARPRGQFRILPIAPQLAGFVGTFTGWSEWSVAVTWQSLVSLKFLSAVCFHGACVFA